MQKISQFSSIAVEMQLSTTAAGCIKRTLCLWAFINPTPTLMAFTGITNAHGPPPHTSQQHAGLQHEAWQLQQEVTMSNERFKPTSPKKSVNDPLRIII